MSVISSLVVLGFWQLQRLEWKNAILSKIEDNYSNTLIDFPFHDDTSEFEYMRSKIEGNYLPDRLMFFYKSNLAGDPGLSLIHISEPTRPY